MADIKNLGAELVALTPQLPEFTKAGAETHKLTFPILTDPGNAVGEAYGLAFELPASLKTIYSGFGLDLQRFNGDASWRLSIPARIVIRMGGIVAAVEADPDYTTRPDPEETLAILRRL
ncbi:MAG: redoxin domain-containing protein [Proteobacteria bacterium]|nr:redoxin domain-containing protein [Pseudomonadota bacterium]MBI3495881.1 redoxin domain-containing protein [Pseudomonadota bacterium]